jgi:parallel beta-helix repeat protein
MKISITSLMIIILTTNQLTFADFPIRQSNNWEGSSRIAYNSTDHEYLVVWSEYTKVGSFYMIGPIMGQRVSENGNPVGNVFTIFSLGTLPDVAYNSKKNEYVVVSAYLNTISAQQVSNTGNLLGSPFVLVHGLPSWPRIVYNSLSGRYLSIVSYIDENPPSSGNHVLRILYSTFSIENQQYFVHSTGQWEETLIGNEFDQSRYALAFAPIQSPETPNGRFLLAVQTHTGINLTMLDSRGNPINVVYEPQSQQYFRYIPFSEGSVVGGEFNVDVAYGMKAGYNLPGPAFFVVWGDNNNKWDGQEWSGIYGSFVDPYKLNYLTTDTVKDNTFPVSAIYDHYAYNTNEYAKSWKPKVAYNNAGQKFMVTWRETPTTNAQNDTKVNHIRADKEYTGGSFYTPNNVISAISGSENPMQPAIAASTINPTALITWDDYRNFSTTDWDIYGSLYSIPSVPSITVTKPNGGENWFIDTEYEITWKSYDYSNPVRIEYSTDGGATYIEITNSTPNDGSYMWMVPFTLSDYCVVKISDATDSDPFDISDWVFKITTTKKIVINTKDSGYGSLRQAIIDANNTAGFDTIIFKIPGTGVHTIQPLTQLPEITDPVLIDGFSQPGSSTNTNTISQGCNAYLNIELNGTYTGLSSNGLQIKAGSSGVRGLIINSFSENGIKIDTYGKNVISGNFIGTDPSGLTALGNRLGIYIENVSENVIGGTSPGERNIISGNTNGIYIEKESATGNKIFGNYFGVDITGLNKLEQAKNVTLYNAPGNYIGGSVEGAGNVISGSGFTSMSYAPPWAGINILGINSTNNIIQGNYIGTDRAGLNLIGNRQAGVTIESNHNTVGGSSVAERNIISGNGAGIYISGEYNIIRGNFIGTKVNGIDPLENDEGLFITGKYNVVGGMTASESNLIAFNRKDGIKIIYTPSDPPNPTIATGNSVYENSIFTNGGLGINLLGGTENSYGVTLNDPGDSDSGPNNLQNYPVLTKVEVDIGTFITGSLNSTPNTTFRIDFYSSPVGDPSGYGEGQTHIGWTELTTDANGNADFYTSIGFIPPAGHVITSTATDPDGSTSEFSNWIKTAEPTTYLVNNTNDSGSGSLRQAIIDANNNPGLDSIAFNIPGTGPFTIQPNTELPSITDPVIIDGYSQPGSHPNMYPISEGSNAEIKIELSGANVSTLSPGLNINSDNCTIRGLAVNQFNLGIEIFGGGGHKIEGCYIGTEITGSGAFGNGVGIYIDSSNHNIIGGLNPEARNLISGNGHAIHLMYCMNNIIQGNYIGTDVSGLLYLANTIGIVIHNSQSCLVGGAVDGSENIISNSSTQGLYLGQSSYNQIQNNFIGLDRTGTIKLGNSDGLQISLGSNGNNILNNRIGGNSSNGIVIMDDSKYNVIADNFIGTDENWQYDLGNGLNGMVLTGHSLFPDYNSIENNSVAFNGGDGVWIEKGKYNTLSRNLISKNVGKGIETINGGNKELSPPIISSVGSTEVTGTTNPGYHVEVFADDDDEARYYLGSTTATGSGNFSFTLTEPVPLQHVTATCTDLEGNTSEFRAPFVVTGINDEKDKIPTEYSLYQNYPNPFNPSTKISWQSPVRSWQTLKVYDVLGNEIVVLIDEEKEAGYHSVEFNASSPALAGQALPSGVYFYQLLVSALQSKDGKAGEFRQTRKMVLIR